MCFLCFNKVKIPLGLAEEVVLLSLGARVGQSGPFYTAFLFKESPQKLKLE